MKKMRNLCPFLFIQPIFASGYLLTLATQFSILIVCHNLMKVKNRNFKKVAHKENQKLGSRKI